MCPDSRAAQPEVRSGSATGEASETSALDALVDALSAEFERDPRGARVAALLTDYANAHRDWRAFALFSPAGYTRNLVARTADFELLILCWGGGHASPIHNHAGQDCWMAVLEGDVEELRYPEPAPGHVGPLESISASVARRGDVAFIRDEIGLHLVRAAREDEPAISLHLYAKPYRTCNVYCPDTGAITAKTLCDYSERGRVCEA